MIVPDVLVFWFPQEYADYFFTLKAFVALIGVLTLIWHMAHKWDSDEPSLGQRLRYYTLLAFAVVVAGGSAEQLSDNSEVNYRSVGALVAVTLLIIAMFVSIHEQSKYRQRKKKEQS